MQRDNAREKNRVLEKSFDVHNCTCDGRRFVVVLVVVVVVVVVSLTFLGFLKVSAGKKEQMKIKDNLRHDKHSVRESNCLSVDGTLTLRDTTGS